MKTLKTREDWRTLGSWKTGVVVMCLLGFPFADYVVRYMIAHVFV
jgi:hypothetical protein